MQTFEVKTYKVSAHLMRHRSGSNVRAVTERSLSFEGPILYHGFKNRGLFAFSDQFNSFNSDVAGYASHSADGLLVVGWFPRREFEDYYEIAQSEKPLFVEYTVREAGAFTGYCRRIGLNTGAEPVGEGPADGEAALAQMMMSRTMGQLAGNSMLPPTDIEFGIDLSKEGSGAQPISAG